MDCWVALRSSVILNVHCENKYQMYYVKWVPICTSVNLVHNAPVDLPPAHGLCWPPPPPPPLSWVITVTENKTHQKTKKTKKQRSE